MMELEAGIVPIMGIGTLALGKRSRVSAGALAAVAMAGAFAAFVMLQRSCPMSHVASHVLLFCFGGSIAAGLIGMAEGRVLAIP
jgi:hypothetical protein